VTTRPVFDEQDNAADNALSDAMHASTLDEQRKFLLIAQVEATRSQTAAIDRLVEEQRTANLIAADAADLIRGPREIGSAEYQAYWAEHAGNITQRLGMNA
jgi:hypothetical protein